MSQHRHTHLCLRFCHTHAVKLYITRSNDACPTHKHTLQLCIMWSNDACSWGARYIHPAVPYILPEPPVACDSSFDALQAHFPRLHISSALLFSGEIWLQRQPWCLDIITCDEILCELRKRSSSLTLHHSLQLFLIKAGVSEVLAWFAAVVDPSSEPSDFWSQDPTQDFQTLWDLMRLTSLNVTRWVRQISSKKTSGLHLQSC